MLERTRDRKVTGRSFWNDNDVVVDVDGEIGVEDGCRGHDLSAVALVSVAMYNGAARSKCV